MPESKISNAPENNSFAASFIHFEVKERTQILHGGGRKQGRDLITG